MKKKFGSYFINTDDIDSSLQNKQEKRVFVQLPEGLQQYTMELKQWLEETYSVMVIMDANATFGACDIPSASVINQLEIALIIQFGHLPMPSLNTRNYSIPILFVNVQSSLPVSSVVSKSISSLPGTTIGVVTTAQHLHELNKIQSLLEQNGYTVVLGEGDNRIGMPGQMLGCNFSVATSIADEIDSFLFVGSGFFHSLGLLLATSKPVVIADPYSNQVIDHTVLQERKQQLLRQRYGAIAFAKQAKTVGVLIGLKPGQQRMKYAIDIHQLVKKTGKQSLLLASDEIHSSLIDQFPFIDVFVSTACPRIAIDDYTTFKKPILTPFEIEVAMGTKHWDDYTFDEICE